MCRQLWDIDTFDQAYAASVISPLVSVDKMFLIAEYCRGPFYMGWHLYLRDYRAFRRNKDGSWGWIRMGGWSWMQPRVLKFLQSIGIDIRGDGIAEFARRYPIKGRRCGGKLRGCIEVKIDEFDEITIKD